MSENNTDDYEKQLKSMQDASKENCAKSSLWNNPSVKQAYKALTPEQLRAFKKMGEHMYGNIDFECKEGIDELLPPVEEAAAYIIEGLKAGLHPSYLDDDERNVMNEAYGSEWYKTWDETWDGKSVE